jgi:hypothetical protein
MPFDSPPSNADACIISYPKSGRTWLRVLLGMALCREFGVDSEVLLDTPALTDGVGLLRTHFHHDGSDIRAGLDYASLPADKRAYRDKIVIFLARDPRDVLVSSYFEATRRSFVFQEAPVWFDGSLSEFVCSPVFGAKKIAAFYEIWARNEAVPRSFLLIRYEQLHAAPQEVVSTVLRSLGARDVREESISDAVKYARFENMRRLERSNAFQFPGLRPGDASDPESYKVRRGRVGGFVDYLSPADVAHIDCEFALRRAPFGYPHK